MTRLLCVHWSVTPLSAPQPRLFCGGCGQPRAFESSGKFRLNANGKQLDAWLLYQCTHCQSTWKRPVIERRTVRALDQGFLEALQSNDAALAEALAFNLAGLRRFAGEIEICGDVAVRKAAVSGPTCAPSRIEIELSLPCPTALRTDRLLARELGLSREGIRKLETTGRLHAVQEGGRRLRRPPADGLRIALDLSGEKDAMAIALAARGQSRQAPTW